MVYKIHLLRKLDEIFEKFLEFCLTIFAMVVMTSVVSIIVYNSFSFLFGEPYLIDSLTIGFVVTLISTFAMIAEENIYNYFKRRFH